MKFKIGVILAFLLTTFLHSQIITSTAISPKEEFLTLGSSDGGIYIFNIFSPDMIYKKKHIGAITDIEYVPQGDVFLSTGLDGNLFCWNTSGEIITQRPTHTDEALYSVSITPGKADHFLYGGMKGDIYFCDFNSFKLIDIYKTNHHAISKLCYSKHYNDEFIVCYYDGVLEKRYVVSKNDITFTSNKNNIITELIYTIDNSKYIVGYETGDIEVYDEDSNIRITRFSDFVSTILSLDVTDDGIYLIGGSEDSSAIFWDLDSRKRIFVSPKLNGRVVGTYFIEKDRLIINISDKNTIYFFDRIDLSTKGKILFNENSMIYFFNKKYELFVVNNNFQRFPAFLNINDYKEEKNLFERIIRSN